MKKKITFAIATLAAAGFTSANALADNGASTVKSDNKFLDIKKLFETMSQDHTYTLAQHRSHASHASHGSHASHRSYYKPPEIDEGDLFVSNENPGLEFAVARNDRSTPATSILPSSPAISKKLKVLKGNSAKFGKIVAQSQLALLARGHDVGSVSGKLDAKTRAEIFKFQSSNGMAPDGNLTPDVLTALNIAVR